MIYEVPMADIELCLFDIARLGDVIEGAASTEQDVTAIRGILRAAARIAEAEIGPVDRVADTIGARFLDGEVSMPPGFAEAYDKWRSGGWLGVDAPEAQGGLGLPIAVGAACTEMWHGGSMGFAMGFLLTQAAAEVLAAHGSDHLRSLYIPQLMDGSATATMSLTEPQAGSDLSLIRGRATLCADGTYRLSASKIFISFGEHDMADNIVHMVLARTPDAPAGNRGLSLFLAPKFLPAADGKSANRNRINCLGIERKMGLNGSPTCAMRYGDDEEGAIAWLVGAEGQGLSAMFTMMNRARLGTGLQGTAIGHKAWRLATTYAAGREQGGRPIAQHPDVQRTLLNMRGDVLASRAISYLAAVALDHARGARDADERAKAEMRAALLTPIVKAFASELGCETAYRAIQIHGGMGYVEETGVAQLYRDSRIAPIYEGTNAIQAIDLVRRKIVLAGSAAAEELIAELREDCERAAQQADPRLHWCAQLCAGALDHVARSIEWLLESHRDEQDRLWGASAFLELFGCAICGPLLLRGALSTPPGSERREDLVQAATAFALSRVTRAEGLAEQVRETGRLLDNAASRQPQPA